MATKKKNDRLDGTDRWTSKGYGIVPGPLSAKERAEIAELNKELDAAKKKKSAAKPTTKKR